jgi:hypothetical protein
LEGKKYTTPEGQHTKHQTQNTKPKTPNTKHQTPNPLLIGETGWPDF